MALCARDAGWTAGACHRRSAGPVPFGRLTTAHCRAGGRGSVSATDIDSGANGYRRFACSLECGFDLPAAVGAAGRAGSAVPYLGPLGAPYETWRPTVRPAAACRPPLRLRRTVLHAPVDRPQTAVANRSAAHGRAGYAWHRLRTGDAGPGGSAHLCRGRHDHVRDHPDLRRDLWQTWRLRQPLRIHHAIGLVLALGGIALVATQRLGGAGAQSITAAGVVLIMISAVSIALYYVISAELSRHYPVTTVAAWSSLIGVVPLLPMTARGGVAAAGLTGAAIVLYLGLLVTVAGMWIWLSLLRALPARIAAGSQDPSAADRRGGVGLAVQRCNRSGLRRRHRAGVYRHRADIRALKPKVTRDRAPHPAN